MSTFFTKLIPLFIYPLGFSILLLVAAAIFVKRKHLARALLILAVIVLWTASTSWASSWLARSLEWLYLAPDEIPPSEVIVVLGGGTEPQQYPRPLAEVNSAGDRLIYAAQLYHDGAAPNILLSGGRLPWQNIKGTPAEEMAQLMQMLGVPEDAMWLEGRSRNTYENALYTHEILEPKGIDEILLVTSASHMPRSVKLFEAQGFQVIPIPVDYSVTELGWEEMTRPDIYAQILNFTPSAGNLSKTTSMLKEYLGMLFYDLRGWN